LAVTNGGVCGVGACGFWRYRKSPVQTANFELEELLAAAMFNSREGKSWHGQLIPKILFLRLCNARSGPDLKHNPLPQKEEEEEKKHDYLYSASHSLCVYVLLTSFLYPLHLRGWTFFLTVRREAKRCVGGTN